MTSQRRGRLINEAKNVLTYSAFHGSMENYLTGDPRYDKHMTTVHTLAHIKKSSPEEREQLKKVFKAMLNKEIDNSLAIIRRIVAPEDTELRTNYIKERLNEKIRLYNDKGGNVEIALENIRAKHDTPNHPIPYQALTDTKRIVDYIVDGVMSSPIPQSFEEGALGGFKLANFETSTERYFGLDITSPLEISLYSSNYSLSKQYILKQFERKDNEYTNYLRELLDNFNKSVDEKNGNIVILNDAFAVLGQLQCLNPIPYISKMTHTSSHFIVPISVDSAEEIFNTTLYLLVQRKFLLPITEYRDGCLGKKVDSSVEIFKELDRKFGVTFYANLEEIYYILMTYEDVGIRCFLIRGLYDMIFTFEDYHLNLLDDGNAYAIKHRYKLKEVYLSWTDEFHTSLRRYKMKAPQDSKEYVATIVDLILARLRFFGKRTVAPSTIMM